MIRGLHGIVYTERADELRAFLRDGLGLSATDVGEGWLIFPLSEGEIACHPTDTADGAPHDSHALSFYCDDLAATVAELARRGVPTPPIEDHGYGLVTFVEGPAGHRIQLYQPSYSVERPASGAAAGTGAAAGGGGEAVALLRHTVATLAYRAAKTLRDAPASFAAYRAGDGGRTALAILTHVGDLLDWAVTICDDRQTWSEAQPRSWEEQVERFFAGLRRLDARLAGAPLRCAPGALFQGPIADALTHVGQLNMMRRLAGAPVRGENYSRAEIVAGRVGAEQAPPRREFD
jgi:hypothetical protein